MDRITVDVAFSIVPEWLIDLDVSDRAIRLYAVLARYADAQGHAWPSRRTLADRTHRSTQSVDRAIAELVAVGALTIEARFDEAGDRTSNLYTLRRVISEPTGGVISEPTGGVTDEATGGVISEPTGGVISEPVTRAIRNESHIEREEDTCGEPMLWEPWKSCPIARPCWAHEPDPDLTGRRVEWEAVALVAGLDPTGRRLTRSEAGRVSAAWKEIRDAGGTVADILDRAMEYRSRWPTMDLTATALASNWGTLANPKPKQTVSGLMARLRNEHALRR